MDHHSWTGVRMLTLNDDLLRSMWTAKLSDLLEVFRQLPIAIRVRMGAETPLERKRAAVPQRADQRNPSVFSQEHSSHSITRSERGFVRGAICAQDRPLPTIDRTVTKSNSPHQ